MKNNANHNGIKHYILFFLYICCISCQGQEYDKDILNLKELDLGLNADRFYKNSTKRENVKLLSGKQYVEKDTITEYDHEWNGDRNKIFAIQYRVVGYSPADVVAQFGNIHFSRVESLVDDKGNLMLINAVTKASKDDILKFITALKKEYPNPEVTEASSGYTNNQIITWKDKDRIIKLSTNARLDFSNPHNILSEADKKEIQEIEKNRITESTLFICNSTYEKKLLGNLHSGNWMNFK